MKGSLREAQFIAHHEPFMTFGNVPQAEFEFAEIPARYRS